MKLNWFGLLLTPLFLLSGCGQQGTDSQQQALELRTTYLSMTACQGTLQVTADYGQRVYTYEMDMTWQGDATQGETTLVVTQPDIIAGLTITATQGESTLQYYGISIETGPLYEDGPNPIETIPYFLEVVRSGFIAECGYELVGEEEQLRFTCRSVDNPSGTGEEVTLWFSKEDGLLQRGELAVDGVTMITCVFEDFSMVVPF